MVTQDCKPCHEGSISAKCTAGRQPSLFPSSTSHLQQQQPGTSWCAPRSKSSSWGRGGLLQQALLQFRIPAVLSLQVICVKASPAHQLSDLECCLCSLQQHLHRERVSHQLRENTRLGIFTLQSQEAFTPGKGLLNWFLPGPLFPAKSEAEQYQTHTVVSLVTPTLDKKIKAKLWLV